MNSYLCEVTCKEYNEKVNKNTLILCYVFVDFSLGVILPGACYVELALEASITSNKLEPAIVKNISFDNVLPLHEHVIRKVKCTKVVSDQGESFQFEIIHVTDQGDVPLSSATLISFEKKSIGPTFTLCEASKLMLDKKFNLT